MAAKTKNPLKITASLQGLAVPVKNLRPDPKNANSHNPQNLAAIKESLEQFGQLKAIVATADGVVRAGNGTLAAALDMGATEIAVVFIPKELEARADEFALADNQSGRLSAWDDKKLKAAIEKIRGRGGDVLSLGFDKRAIEEMIGRITAAKPTPVPVLPATFNYQEQHAVVVTCRSPEEQEKVYSKLLAEGYTVKVVSV